tara:strand:+ start:22398 stop:22892 length:495 start_codon:yes stop_codon:yes gene_type:complete
MLLSFASFAETIVVMETHMPRTMNRPMISDKFFMDTNTNLGYADIKVTVEQYRPEPRMRRMFCDHRGYRYGTYPGVRPDYMRRCEPLYTRPLPMIRTILDEKIEIPGLELVGKDMIYYGVNGEVKCGNLGRSRVFGAPTLYLTGNCQLKTKIRRNKLIVEFTAN